MKRQPQVKLLSTRQKKTGSTPDNNSRLDSEVNVPLIYLSNFW